MDWMALAGTRMVGSYLLESLVEGFTAVKVSESGEEEIQAARVGGSTRIGRGESKVWFKDKKN